MVSSVIWMHQGQHSHFTFINLSKACCVDSSHGASDKCLPSKRTYILPMLADDENAKKRDKYRGNRSKGIEKTPRMWYTVSKKTQQETIKTRVLFQTWSSLYHV